MESDKRATVKLKKPNPLFEKWIKEWYNHAKENNFKTQYSLHAALASIKKYPIPLESGKECKILKGFGDKLCMKLDEKLKEHRTSKSSEYTNTSHNGLEIDTISNKSPLKQTKTSRSIKPKLKKNQSDSDIGNSTQLGPNNCDILPNKHLSNEQIDQLLEHKDTLNLDINNRIGNNASKQQQQSKQNSSSTSAKDTQETTDFIFAPNTFDIILCVDNQETSGKRNQQDALISELTQLCVQFEVRHLKVSDYLWICRERISGNELVLPYLVERKRMDDFAHSVKDGRYHEQKFRLKKSGIENVMYLIESHGSNEHLGLPLRSLYQAASNTAIQDGFLIKFTNNLMETSKYLADLSKLFMRMYKSKTLICSSKENLSQNSGELIFLMPFKDFNKVNAKNKRPQISDLFTKMLIQIKGMSVDRALAIVEKYPTPFILHRQYKQLSEKQGEELLKGIKYGNFKKQIGPILSRTVYQLFSKKNC